jgi:hypothetical protein
MQISKYFRIYSFLILSSLGHPLAVLRTLISCARMLLAFSFFFNKVSISYVNVGTAITV